jgi:ADP-L-glycero-D-manno-heptose 6-epimerase
MPMAKAGPGLFEQAFRDFPDMVKINLFFARGPSRHGIVNVGTGQSRSFNDVADAVLEVHGAGKVEYIPFPDDLKDRYQSFTEADIRSLREMGYVAPLSGLAEGIRKTFSDMRTLLDYGSSELIPGISSGIRTTNI